MDDYKLSIGKPRLNGWVPLGGWASSWLRQLKDGRCSLGSQFEDDQAGYHVSSSVLVPPGAVADIANQLQKISDETGPWGAPASLYGWQEPLYFLRILLHSTTHGI